MRIRTARKEDLNEFLRLRKDYLKEYSKMSGEHAEFVKKEGMKEINDAIYNKNWLLLFLEEDNKIKGYLLGIFTVTPHYKNASIHDLFICKDGRKKGYATVLIKKFMEISSKKSIKRFSLGVDVKNKKAIRLYKKLGFRINRYGMVKRK